MQTPQYGQKSCDMTDISYQGLHPLPDAETAYLRWIAHLDTEFTRHQNPDRRSEIVRDQLHQLYLGRPHGGKVNFTLDTELPFNVLELTLDPRNVTLEAEYSSEGSTEQYALRKPLLWFWQMFDRSPVGLNHWLGFRFRALLGRHLFRHIGHNVAIFHGVEFPYGHNLTIEDDCVVHSHVRLNDRGEILLRRGSSIAEYAILGAPAQHGDHPPTEIGPNKHVSYGAVIRAGERVDY
jgi:acetyltransferase-like isoleucine patch superfamily enzyme